MIVDQNGNNRTQLTKNSGFNAAPRWLSDSSQICFESDRVAQGHFDIVIMNRDGLLQQRLTSDAAPDYSPCFQPLVQHADVRVRNLIGPSGILGQEAAGFLYAQSGKHVRAVVAFDTPPTLRSSVRVSAMTGLTGLSNIIFSLQSDSITRLAFVNGAFAPTTIIGVNGAVPSATGALVSFDAADGSVTAVVPYNTASRSASAPRITDQKGTHILHGKFLGVFDGSGKNLAPSGASEVQIDAKTSKIVAVK